MDLNRYQGLIFDLDGTLVDLNVKWKKVRKSGFDINVRIKQECKTKRWKPNMALINYINCTSQPFAIYSMNSQECIATFIKMYLDRIPEVIVSIQSRDAPKPTALDLITILNKMKMDRWNVLFIGNSEKDKKSGNLARIKTIII